MHRRESNFKRSAKVKKATQTNGTHNGGFKELSFWGITSSQNPTSRLTKIIHRIPQFGLQIVQCPMTSDSFNSSLLLSPTSSPKSFQLPFRRITFRYLGPWRPKKTIFLIQNYSIRFSWLKNQRILF